MALDVDLDEADIVQRQIVEPFHGTSMSRPGCRLRRERVCAVDRASTGTDSSTRIAVTPGLSDNATASTRTACTDRFEHRRQLPCLDGRGSKAITDSEDSSIAIENPPTSAPMSSDTRAGSHSDRASRTQGPMAQALLNSEFACQNHRGAMVFATDTSRRFTETVTDNRPPHVC